MPRFNARGFTLLELLLTISIVTICITLACPNFYFYSKKINSRAITKQIINELFVAQSEAIRKNQMISYTTNQEGDDWSAKRIIKDGFGHTLHEFAPLPKSYSLQLRNSLNVNNRIIFTPLGFTLSQRSSFYLQTSEELVRIIINVSGEIRVSELGSGLHVW